MSTFRLSDEDEAPAPPSQPDPKATPPTPTPEVKTSPTQPAVPDASEYEYFLGDDAAKPSAAPHPTQPTQPVTPTAAQTPSGATATPAAQAPRVKPVTPVKPIARPNHPAPTVAQAASATPATAPVTPGTIAANAKAAAEATSPATAPQTDANSIATTGPSDDFNANIAQMGMVVKKALDAFGEVALWFARIAFPLAALSFGYILVAIFLGGAANITQNPNGALLAHNLLMASKVFSVSLVVLSLSLMLVAYDDNRFGALVAGIGLLLFFAAPLGIKALVGTNIASAAIVQPLRTTSLTLIGAGMLKAFFDLMVFLWGLPDRIKMKNATVGMGRQVEAKQRQVAKEANATSPCWKLPYCRESIRKMCPAFLAKKTCWKFGRGCYCDEEMIARIVRGDSLDVIKAPTRMSTAKPPCGKCYIYLEHQTHKFRMLSPLVLPASVIITYLVWPIYTGSFGGILRGFTSLFTSLSFSATSLTPDAIKTSQANIDAANSYAADPTFVINVTMTIIGVMLGFFLLIYLSKFLEWAIFKAKL